MRIVKALGKEGLATVYIAEVRRGKLIEFVESLQPPMPREKKWVIIVSTLFGCPVRCPMCDAGGGYEGRLDKEEIFDQIDFLVRKRYPDGAVPAEKFKVQFARIGEPSLNPCVIDVLEEIAGRYQAPGLVPCVSTIAPGGSDDFFERLADVKKRRYRGGKFQLQFSIHTTDEKLRDMMIPARKWSFARIARYAERFHEDGDRKITLNFALARGMPVDAAVLSSFFYPELFLVKLTPVNPTHRAVENKLESYIDAYGDTGSCAVVDGLRSAGYEVILSVGEVEENRIGSNCGQYVMRHLKSEGQIPPPHPGYDYWLLGTDHSNILAWKEL